jgi:mannose-6-phosphate isomerase-like protein (cupin superfamily)
MARSAVARSNTWRVAGGTLLLAASFAPQTGWSAEPPASRQVVFLTNDELARAVSAPSTTGMTMASLGSVRADDDRISVDEIKRWDAAAEGPVSHTVVTEVYYILDGGGIMETGGTMTDPVPLLTDGKPTNPASIGASLRGTKISGGSTHHVARGDVVMIPPGTPHRFLSLDEFVTYIVVRVNPGYERGK